MADLMKLMRVGSLASLGEDDGQFEGKDDDFELGTEVGIEVEERGGCEGNAPGIELGWLQNVSEAGLGISARDRVELA